MSRWVLAETPQRIQDYLVIDQEPSSVPEKEPPASWPTSGEIVLDKLSAKYSEDGPTVLDNLEVTIKSGEKVGIVGRTGSGKSTLVSARKASTRGLVLRVAVTQPSVMLTDGIGVGSAPDDPDDGQCTHRRRQDGEDQPACSAVERDHHSPGPGEPMRTRAFAGMLGGGWLTGVQILLSGSLRFNLVSSLALGFFAPENLR